MKKDSNRSKMLIVLTILLLGTFSAGIVAGQGRGDSCETISLKLDVVRNAFSKDESKKNLILIGKIGSLDGIGYSGRQRLYAAKEYLAAMGVSRDRIITAEGDAVPGLGRIEVYLDGQLYDVLAANKKADIPLGSCDNDKIDKKYQLPGKRTRSKRKHK